MKFRIWSTLLAGLLFAGTACEKEQKPTPTQEKEATQETQETEPTQAPATEELEGNWVKSAKYGVKFRVPDDWKIVESADAVSATSPDDTITIILVGTGSETMFEAAMASISNEVKLSDIKSEKSSMAMINGLAGFQGSGSAVLDLDDGKQEIQFIGYALRIDAENAIALMIFAEAEMYEARKEELEGIVKTIQKG